MECCEESPQKIKKPNTNLACIICGESLDKAGEGNVICNPTTQGIKTSASAAEKRNDDVY